MFWPLSINENFLELLLGKVIDHLLLDLYYLMYALSWPPSKLTLRGVVWVWIISQLISHSCSCALPCLPIHERIRFKLALFMYKARTNHLPPYLSSMVTLCSSVKGRPSHRSASDRKYVIPSTRLVFGQRSFTVASPSIWNWGHPFMMSTKKSRFWPPSPCPHGTDPPLVDVHTRSTWNTHRSLEMASTMTYRT